MSRFLLSILTLIALSPSQAMANFEDIRLLFGSFSSEIKFSPYYGTLTLAASDRSYLYYVTNSHAIPPHVGMRDKIDVELEIRENSASAQLIHNAPGYDLAIFRVKRSNDDFVDYNTLNRIIEQTWEHDLDDAKAPVHIGILGVAGKVMRGELTFRNLPWFEEWDIINDPRAPYKHSTYTVRQRPRVLSMNKYKLEKTFDCPPAFVEACIRLPIRSWGYSGGALLASHTQRINNETRIAGLVSYFGPLSDKTLIIPASVVYKVALCMLGMKGCKNQPELFNDNSSIKFLSAGCYELRSGDFAGKIVRSHMVTHCSNTKSASNNLQRYPLIAVGGGGSMGGGGGSMGGGGGSMGGGGELNNRMQFKKNRRLLLTDFNGNVTGLGKFDQLLKEIEDPASWCKSDSYLCTFLKQDPSIRGVDIFLNYRAGFDLGNQRYSDYNLTQFLACYAKNGNADCLRKPINHLESIPWDNLEIDSNIGYGLGSSRYIMRLKTAADIAQDEHQGRAHSMTPTELAFFGVSGRLALDTKKFMNDYRRANAATRRHNYKAYQDTLLYQNLDVITDRTDGLWPYTPANYFEAKRNGNTISVTWGVGRVGEKPSLVRFEAEVVSEIRKPDYIKMIVNLNGKSPDKPLKGLFIVSYDKSRDLYEVRLVGAEQWELSNAKSLFAGIPNSHERKIMKAVDSILKRDSSIDPNSTLEDLLDILKESNRFDDIITEKELDHAIFLSISLSDQIPLNRLNDAFRTDEYLADFAEIIQQNDKSVVGINMIYFPLKTKDLNKLSAERGTADERLEFFKEFPDAPSQPEVIKLEDHQQEIIDTMKEIGVYMRR